ncbi:MAG: GDP-mannose 4,6-dehydratase, partial [Acidobacteriota bacterium]
EERPHVFGDGEQSRDFTYVANVVEANLRAVEASPDAVGEVFNIACGERTTVNALLREIGELTGRSVEPFYDDPRTGDVRHSSADISKAIRFLGFSPQVGFKQGLKRTVAWFRERSLG